MSQETEYARRMLTPLDADVDAMEAILDAIENLELRVAAIEAKFAPQPLKEKDGCG